LAAPPLPPSCIDAISQINICKRVYIGSGGKRVLLLMGVASISYHVPSSGKLTLFVRRGFLLQVTLQSLLLWLTYLNLRPTDSTSAIPTGVYRTCPYSFVPYCRLPYTLSTIPIYTQYNK
jgi:hypothetical protein